MFFFKAEKSQYVENSIDALKLINNAEHSFAFSCIVIKGNCVRCARVSWTLKLDISLFLVLRQMGFPSLQREIAVLLLRNQAYGFLIQSSKPNMRGSLISRYYISPKVIIHPSYSVNIWHVTQK